MGNKETFLYNARSLAFQLNQINFQNTFPSRTIHFKLANYR